MTKANGFTLLEVLIALVILSSVTIVIVRGTGEGLTQVADNGWRDNAIRLGREKMLELVRVGINGNMQGILGSPGQGIEWQARVRKLKNREGRIVELVISENVGSLKHEAILEQIVFP